MYAYLLCKTAIEVSLTENECFERLTDILMNEKLDRENYEKVKEEFFRKFA